MTKQNSSSLTVLQVSALDRAGGAEQVAWNLFQSYRQAGLASWLAVGKKRSKDRNVFVINEKPSQNWWVYLCRELANVLNPLAGKLRGILRLQAWLRSISKGRDWLADQRGEENFYFPGSWDLLNQAPQKPSVLHLHNLHGGYFDPRALTALSSEIPIILTLHDAWLLSGNCAHSLGCERWKNGCGECPDISIYPGLKVDSTHLNWKRRKDIFDHSKFYIATPCQWLLDKVSESILEPAMLEGRVIYNGVDTSIFYPGEKQLARKGLGLPINEPILLFVANGIKNNPFKDYATLQKIIELLGEQSQTPLHFIALGEDGEQEQIGKVTIHYISRTSDMCSVAQYYRASDLYVHVAKAETFPNTVLEAMACGLPVIASNVGGIPEQIEDGITGLLIPAQNAELMTRSISLLLRDSVLREKMGKAALLKVKECFTLDHQVDQYLQWYEEILKSRVK
jgi:glycosyltransferase involved in cell wall biosynthesis